MKPHGLDLILKEEILENGKVVNSFINKNSLEGWVEISNSKTGKQAKFPMRSFVSLFMNRVHGILSGDAGDDTKLTKVYASSAASLAYHTGLQIGLGNTKVTLSDSALETQAPQNEASLASLGYGAHTFTEPYEKSISPVVLECLVKRLFSNEAAGTYYINEVGLVGKDTSLTASNTGNVLLARDLIYNGQTEQGIKGITPAGNPISFVPDSDMRIDFRFMITHGATGGLVLNFMKLIYNLMFVGSPMNSTSKIINVNSGNTTYTYASNAVSATSSFCNISGAVADIYKGIVVGADNLDAISADYVDMGDYKSDEFTLSANTISAIIAQNQKASFTISRTFTNNSTTAIVIDKVGIMGRGNGGGATQDETEFLMAANVAGGSFITVQPSQTYRVTYKFAIQV
ncbi:MAG TPA: hypothetical protein VMV86_01755 [Methanosarcinales archaeon]|nr:hypothetical protein [Methanosarcinales archaeon]